MPVPGARFLLMGVMSNPSKDGLRERIRTWNRHFATAGREVHVRFVYGRQFYNGTGDDDALRHYAREVGEHRHGLKRGDRRARAGGEHGEEAAAGADVDRGAI